MTWQSFNRLGQAMSRTYNGAGQLMQTTDALAGVTRYAYDGAGNLIVLEDANGQRIRSRYDALGQKRRVDDPNMGVQTFTYNGFAELISQRDANGNTTSYGYDRLGRQTQRRVQGPNEDSTQHFVFDKPSRLAYVNNTPHNLCYGAMAQEYVTETSALDNTQTTPQYLRHYAYDNLCRIKHDTRRIDNKEYVITSLYDGGYGRVKGLIYPNGITLGYEYDQDSGYPKRTYNALTGATYHKVSSVDASGKWTHASYQDEHHKVTRYFDVASGQMYSTALSSSRGTLQRIDYTYDNAFGHLSEQHIQRLNTSTYRQEHAYEAFYYDDLHRLTRTLRARSATALTPGHSDALSVEYGYDAVGNIRFKTDFSAHDGMAYRYGDSQRRARLDNSNAGPNAVRHITLKRAINGSASRQLRYDNNGNLTSDGVRLISYNAMNKPVTIHVSGQRYLHPNDSHRTVTQTTDFAYGSDNLRYKQRSGDVAQTIYIGQQYTEQTLANGTTQQRVYIDDVAIDITSISRGGKHNRIQSLHTDRLGSTVGVFNTSGYLHESRSYDTFGTPRGSLNSDRFNAILGSTVSPRGFTQHEHLDGAQLIHMNGRVYDYHLGRFLSVDPFIQGVGNSQGVNPYSYILNNPLAGTDPSGYVAVTGLDRWSGMPDPMGYGDNCPFCVNTGDDKEGQDNGADAGGQASLNITITADNASVGSGNVSGIGGQAQVGTSQEVIKHSSWGIWDSIQAGLDVAGLVPIIGELADLTNAGISLARGDYEGAVLSLSAMVPIVGNAAGTAKIIRSAEKFTDSNIVTKGIEAKNGLRVEGFTGHGVQRAVGNNSDRAGVSPQGILDALKNPLKIGDIKTDQLGRASQRFIGDTGEVVVNPQTGKIISVNLTSSKKAARLMRQLENSQQ